MDNIKLCGKWNLTVLEHGKHKDYKTVQDIKDNNEEIIEAKVPGNVELDLRNAGKVDDLFFGRNPDRIRRYTERLHCYYYREFDVKTLGNKPFICFEGLDCYADVYINGTFIGKYDNMFIEHKTELSDVLKTGKNEIFIHIYPAVKEAMKYDYPFMATAGKSAYEQLFVRKASHMFGWDIMPRYVSAGIWRPVYIGFEKEEYIKEYYLCTSKVDDSSATVELYYRTECDIVGDVSVKLIGDCEDSHFEKEIKMIFPIGRRAFVLDSPKLWWPRNFGEPKQYDWKLILYRNGEVIDEKHFKQGIARIDLDYSDYIDSDGNGKFNFIVNNRPIFIKGTNWVPASPFHSEDKERIPKMLELAADLECNMIRCWGGNVYEDDLFYETCDRLGIMVWQDFGIACSKNSQDAAFLERMREEATAVVKRLRSHVCIALWSGDNESDLRWYRWESIKMNPQKNRITREVFPEVIMQHDPVRSYLPSSPYISEEVFNLPKGDWSIVPAEDHYYVWSGFYKTAALGKRMMLASEFGSLGCPSPESIVKFISKEKLWSGKDINDEWYMHATSPIPETEEGLFRIGTMFEQLENVFDEEAENLVDFAIKSQITQCECNKFHFERMRSNKWNRTGMLWWNLIDGWPQFSDAAVDHYYERKLMYYGMKAAGQDVCIMIQEKDNANNHKVILVNDTLKKVSIEYSVYDVTNKKMLLSGVATAQENNNLCLGVIPASDENRFMVINWSGDVDGKNHYLDFTDKKPKINVDDYLRWLKDAELFPEWLSKVERWKKDSKKYQP